VTKGRSRNGTRGRHRRTDVRRGPANSVLDRHRSRSIGRPHIRTIRFAPAARPERRSRRVGRRDPTSPPSVCVTVCGVRSRRNALRPDRFGGGSSASHHVATGRPLSTTAHHFESPVRCLDGPYCTRSDRWEKISGPAVSNTVSTMTYESTDRVTPGERATDTAGLPGRSNGRSLATGALGTAPGGTVAERPGTPSRDHARSQVHPGATGTGKSRAAVVPSTASHPPATGTHGGFDPS
jgi:hypothetical protein